MAERIEKLILETEYKVTGIDTNIQKLSELKTATDNVVKADLSKVAADKKVEQAANQLGVAIDTQTKKTAQLADGMVKAGQAMKTIGTSNALKELPVTLDQATAKVKAFYKEIASTGAAGGNVEAVIQKMEKFIAELQPETRDTILDTVAKDAERLDDLMDKPNRRLRELKRLINTETDPVLLRKYQVEAGKLQDKLGDTNDLVKALASDTFLTDSLVEGAQVATGAFTAFQGVLALTTDDQEEFAKAAAKAQGALALLQGVQAVSTALKKDDNIITRGQIIAQQAYTAVVGTSTGALKAFRIAALASGVGLLIAGVAALVANWDKLTNAIFGAAKARKAELELAKESRANVSQELTALTLVDARLKSTTTSQEQRVKIIQDLQQKYPGYLQNINAETASYEDVSRALKQINKDLILKGEIQAREKNVQKLQDEKFELEQIVDAERKRVDGFVKAEQRLKEQAASGANVGLALQQNEEAKQNAIDTLADLQVEYFKKQGQIAAITNDIVNRTNQISDAFDFKPVVDRIDKQGKEVKAKSDKVVQDVFSEGSINALQKKIQDLNTILNEIGADAPDLRNNVARGLKEAEAELEALKAELFGKEKEIAKEENLELFEEEERHQLAMLDLEEGSEKERLQVQIAFTKERLEIMRDAGLIGTDEYEAQLNKLLELQKAYGNASNQQTAKTEELTREQRLDYAQKIISEAVNLANTLIGIEINRLNQMASLQEKRVADAEKIADRGNVKLLELEQERLDEINKKKEKFVKRQQQLAQIELVTSSLIAVAKAAAVGGPGAAFTIAATLIALAAGLAQARALAQSQSFRKGGVYDSRGGYTGYGPPSGQSLALGAKPYEYHYQEHIMPEPVTKIGDNLRWLEKIRTERLDIGRMMRDKKTSVVVNDNRELIGAIRSMPGVTFKLNSKGIISIVEENARQSNRVNSKR